MIAVARDQRLFIYRHMNFWYFNWMMWSALARLVDHCSVKDGNCIWFSHRGRDSEHSVSMRRFYSKYAATSRHDDEIEEKHMHMMKWFYVLSAAALLSSRI